MSLAALPPACQARFWMIFILHTTVMARDFDDPDSTLEIRVVRLRFLSELTHVVTQEAIRCVESSRKSLLSYGTVERLISRAEQAGATFWLESIIESAWASTVAETVKPSP